MSNILDTTTNEELLPKVVNTILGDNVLATRILVAAKKWGAGQKVKVPVKVSSGTSGQSFSGFDALPTNASDTRINMEFGPKFYAKNCALALTDLFQNENQESAAKATIDLAELEMEERAIEMADEIGTIFYGDGTGNSSKDPLGLAALVDDGTTVATIGGQSRSTYTTLKGTVTAAGGTLTLAKMDTMWDAITSGMQSPTLIPTTPTVFSLYGQLLQPQERINKTVGLAKGLKGGTGFTGLDYRGVAVLADEKCTSGYMYFLNENVLEWKAGKMPETTPVPFMSQMEGHVYSNVKGLGFSWGGWQKAFNAAAKNGFIYLAGEFITRNPKRHGVLTGVTGV